MAKKCDRTTDWIEYRQLQMYRLQKLKQVRDRKRRELDRLDNQISDLKQEIGDGCQKDS